MCFIFSSILFLSLTKILLIFILCDFHFLTRISLKFGDQFQYNFHYFTRLRIFVQLRYIKMLSFSYENVLFYTHPKFPS